MRGKLRFALIASTMLAAAPAFAEDKAPPPTADTDAADIVVTARRVEERLQDVPISITVFNQKQLDERNIVSARDLAAYTPSLTANARYGADNSTFTIRGFSQEQRTTATVGVYFADAVTPRGSGSISSGGDGAGPGYFFDLQNVQVLKGPQGTLFGRNTTGGAVLLVPQKPTTRLEGYAEGSYGNYDMKRVQAVLNVPLMDSFRLRLGIDRQTRDGYLNNRSGIGPSRLANVDYIAARFSAVADLTPNLENYTVISFGRSTTTGIVPGLDKCYTANPTTGAPIAAGAIACAQIAREAPYGFYAVSSFVPDPKTRTDQWQIVNTTTWRTSDTLTIKNIASYAELRQRQSIDLFGYLQTGVGVLPSIGFGSIRTPPGGFTNAQTTLTEELQFQGNALGNKLVYQFGGYVEISDPIGRSGSQQPSRLSCVDVDTFNCALGQSGTVSRALQQNYYRTYAAYAQGSYAITDTLKFTAGIRYTSDRASSDSISETVRFQVQPAPVVYCNRASLGPVGPNGNDFSNGLPLAARDSVCRAHDKVKSSAPTWLLGLDYEPIRDILIYAKYSRGYRQANVAPLAPDGYNKYGKEKVDSYEIGAKTSWRGAVPGSFNVAGFYNDFADQQLQLGFAHISPLPPLVSSTIGVLNVGSSRIYGGEAEINISPFRGLKLEGAYAYLNTKLKKVTPASALTLPYPYDFIAPPVAGGALPYTPKNKYTLGAHYTLPLPDSIGRITFGGSYTRQSEMTVVYNINGKVPGYGLINLDASWNNIAGLPIDLSVFGSNVGKEKYYVHVNDSTTSGFVSYILGEPRMYGVRLRYHFGR